MSHPLKTQPNLETIGLRRRAPRAGGKEANLWINAVVANNLVHRRREVGGVSSDFDGSLLATAERVDEVGLVC